MAHPERSGPVDEIVDLSEQSLEQVLVEMKKAPGPLTLKPTKWFLKTEVPDGLKRFERNSPVLVSPGRRWFRA